MIGIQFYMVVLCFFTPIMVGEEKYSSLLLTLIFLMFNEVLINTEKKFDWIKEKRPVILPAINSWFSC